MELVSFPIMGVEGGVGQKIREREIMPGYNYRARAFCSEKKTRIQPDKFKKVTWKRLVKNNNKEQNSCFISMYDKIHYNK